MNENWVALLKRVAALLLLGAPLWAGTLQQTPPPAGQEPDIPDEEEGFRIGVAVDQVFLSVNVRSPEGGFLHDLTKDDFRVLEDGVNQEILNFYSEAVPVNVVLLIDISGSTREEQGEIQRAAFRFAASLSPEDRVSIVTFNDKPVQILTWTNDLDRVQTALQSIYAKGVTVLNDALYVTFDDLLNEVEGKKAVILLTDGIDTGSMVSFQEALDLAVRSEAMVYIVSQVDQYWAMAMQHRFEYQARAMIVPKELSDEYIIEARKSLNRLANLTGGRVLNARSFASLTDVYAAVAEELKNQYYLSYLPYNIQKDGRWRTVAVQVQRPGASASTRPGYYAEPGAAN